MPIIAPDNYILEKDESGAVQLIPEVNTSSKGYKSLRSPQWGPNIVKKCGQDLAGREHEIKIHSRIRNLQHSQDGGRVPNTWFLPHHRYTC